MIDVKYALAAGAAAVALGAAGACAEERTTEADDGTAIAYEVRGEGDPALVFVHCWSCNRAFWREQADVFAADHRVVLIDLPGHGASGRDREAWTLAAYGDDVARVADAEGLGQVVLVGHSMGGPVALLAAAALGDRVEGVICVDTLHDAEFSMPEEVQQGWAQSFAGDYEGAMREGMGWLVPTDAALRAWVLEQALQADRGAVTALIPELGAFDTRAALSALDAPVRCINAVPWNDYALATAVGTNRRYADFDAVLMDGVGHFPHLERPGEFNGHLRALLEAIEAGE